MEVLKDKNQIIDNFLKFKEECSKTGTTEEAIAQAEKLGFKTTPLEIRKPLLSKQKLPEKVD